ncbi:MAG: hypothetical protein O9341_03905 [Paucibacter sp.]|nr:hypothetical protein [Roseateles sp.]
MSRRSQTSARSAPALRWPLAQAWRVWALLALMLAFQGLGQSHRVLHGAGFARALVPLASLSSLAPLTSVAEAKPVAQAPSEGWGHSRGELICLLLDQLSHDHAPLALPVLVLQDAGFAAPDDARAASLHLAARWKRAARGPPQLA